ncbi:MAG: YraN family protein [Acidimicrobiales bacterium]
MPSRRGLLGKRGEDAVADWYRAHGYSVVDRNWRCPLGELDLVVLGEGGAVLAFCEVKTRSSTVFGSPLEAVTAAKQRRLRRLAGSWLRIAKPPGVRPQRLRLDVAAVRTGPAGTLLIDVLEGAF